MIINPHSLNLNRNFKRILIYQSKWWKITKLRISKFLMLQAQWLNMEISLIKSQIKRDHFLLINQVPIAKVSILKTRSCHLRDTLMMKIRTLLIFQFTVIKLHSAFRIRINNTHFIMINKKAVISYHLVIFHRVNLKLICKLSRMLVMIASIGLIALWIGLLEETKMISKLISKIIN